MNDLYRFENIKIINYGHGGSRVFLEKDKDRQLLCDTYGDEDNFIEMELKEKIHETIKNYFKINKK